MSEIKKEVNLRVDKIMRKLEPLIKREMTEAFRPQMRERYTYLVGKWRGIIRAKSTKTGKIVSMKEVCRHIGCKKT